MSLQNQLINPTEGEILFSNLLDVLDEDYSELLLRHYYEPNGNDQFPDFALYSNIHGIIFFEVKDFTINQIDFFDMKGLEHHAYADGQKHTLSFSRKEIFPVIDEFKVVLSENDSIPVSMAYVFPNIYADEVLSKFGFDLMSNLEDGDAKHKRLISQFVFQDDFEDQEQLLLKLKNLRLFPFTPSKRKEEIAIARLTRYIGSSLIIKNEDGSIQTSLFTNEKKEDEIFVLSKKQEVLLKKWMEGRGYRFLKGSAGTGKTVLLIARAEYLAERIANCNILITYYSSSLDGVFRHLMDKYPQIRAQRILQFCYHQINNEKGEVEKWDEYVRRSLNLLENDFDHPFREFFDFIFVDEGQDFTTDLGRILELMAKGKDHKTKNVIVAFDNKQDINNARNVDTLDTFKGKQSGRVRKLTDSFRSPQEISVIAERLIGEKIESVRSVPNAFIFKKVDSYDDVVKKLNQWINLLIASKRKNIEKKDIAIIYPSLPFLHNKVDELSRSFTFPFQKHKKNAAVRPETQNIKILSTSYCKGLDFKVVFLVFFEELNEEGNLAINKKARDHFYVALTRALHHGILIYTKETPLIDLVVSED